MSIESMNANFAQDEVNKFTSDKDQWWDPFGDYAPLHALNPLRLRFIQKYAPVKGKTVLDVGCGGGILSERLAIDAAAAYAIDMNEQALAAARAHAAENQVKIQYECCLVEDFAKQHANAFDLVTCMEMLEHVPQPESVVAAIAQLTKPGGTVFFSTLNRNLKSYLFGVLAAEYILKLLPKGTHDYQKFIQPHELAAMARHHGLELLASQGIGYNPISQQYYLSHDLSINYLMAFYQPDES